jgi:hypothetical protein
VHVAAYIGLPQGRRSAPTVKQHLACIRMLSDWLVIGQVMPTNPAHSVRGPRHSVTKGSTPVLPSEEATALLAGMDVSAVVGLRDRAVIAVMTYTFARVGAVVALTVEDYFSQKKRWWLWLHEKKRYVHVNTTERTICLRVPMPVESGRHEAANQSQLKSCPQSRVVDTTEFKTGSHMDWQTFESKLLASSAYDAGKGVFCLRFRSGDVYRYLEFPEERYQQLLDAESRGRYFLSHIRNQFRYEGLARLQAA